LILRAADYEPIRGIALVIPRLVIPRIARMSITAHAASPIRSTDREQHVFLLTLRPMWGEMYLT
jgi:hypothetical protein